MLSETSSRVLWMVDEQRRRSENEANKLELIYPRIDRLDTYHSQCHRLAMVTTVGKSALGFFKGRWLVFLLFCLLF